MIKCHYHFTKIAHRYRELRITDLEPILFIKEKLQKHLRIVAADVGCGTGRYDELLFLHLGKKLYLYCIDVNKMMLLKLKEYLTGNGIKNFIPVNSIEKKIPIKDTVLDAVFTFNAIHHFNVVHFLRESTRILKKGGYLFIYTRLRSQNKRNIWGRYFPLFYEKETRLYGLKELKKFIREQPGLEIESLEYFKYARIDSLDKLLERARNCHYSTFYLYTKKEFEDSLKKFELNIKKAFIDTNKVSWFDENILLVVKKYST